ncbi:MAG: hypothetical protein KDE28_21590 [Anaerolineales bacterium]|nr:hypothetical protein [Anaerolineales bacterium]MCB8962893.1 hypothetical protein [Ardenticatenales bacterium]
MNNDRFLDDRQSQLTIFQRLSGPFLVAVAAVVAFLALALPVQAAGMTQFAGVGYIPGPGDCTDEVTGPAGQAPDFATLMTGDLEGCVYVFVESFECSPSGTYRESGTETYVITGGTLGEGTFSTTYIFRGKYEDCADEGFPLGAEIFGRCQHPIISGSGTEDFEGVEGRLHFKDDIAAGNFPYTGHMTR